MKHEEIQALIDQIDQSSIQEFSIKTQTDDVYISKIKDHKQAEPSYVAGQEMESNPVVSAESVHASTPTPAVAPEVNAVSEDENATNANVQTINSPLVGVVYLAKDPEQPAFKSVGDRVEAGETVCIVEAMKVMNEIPATSAGVISKILVSDGQIVEFDQPLFELTES
ncbi:acetyl-CoA carboxylase biotin carboxyl carrier protein [Aerococcus sp. 1KP-2016]|uniref:acetyl-CoA carboxylase biotin carboxyl carrier protein n=1 Tax=Aerococcus sp. 1KP-2016 TaxID=1981982 RepID=UPI000B987577|nr:acetyl-CoA carboxylase biotin carboxyl carrier protein [Aerococcus sp. 1KP-2016]OYQ68146.1 acetyl-CoA carboxylase, biotin carboxyl carrier protein [Aerococcus sp. 1KP-2016]